MPMDPVIRYYDELAENYDENRFNNSYGIFIDMQERALLDKLIVQNNACTLDLACGTGRLSGYATFGTDASYKMAGQVRRKHPDKAFYVARADKLPFAAQSLDIIYAFHFFMHMYHGDIERILAECHRVLKPQGQLIFDIPSKKRRAWLGYRSCPWHGASSLDGHDIQTLCADCFIPVSRHGLLFLPIHRFPGALRLHFLKMDRWLAHAMPPDFLSYFVAVLARR